MKKTKKKSFPWIEYEVNNISHGLCIYSLCTEKYSIDFKGNSILIYIADNIKMKL